MTTYSISYKRDRCLEIMDDIGGYLFYRIPYRLLKSKTYSVDPKNKFVVYLLQGTNSAGRDCLYVGTSKNGMDGRPKEHEDKANWDVCYIFTSSNEKILNNSRILCLENDLRRYIDESDRFVGLTYSTMSDTTNYIDDEYCKKALPVILEVFDILGVNITPHHAKDAVDFSHTLLPVSHSAAGDARDISFLKLPGDMEECLRNIESLVLQSTPNAQKVVASSYLSFQYKGANKTIVYCYPKKTMGKICCLFYGMPDQYNSSEIVLRSDT